MTHKIAIIGFGTVGQGFAEILRDKEQELKERWGFKYCVVAVSDFQKGAIYKPSGLDLALLLKEVKKGDLSGYPRIPKAKRGWDALKTIKDADADIVVEATYTDLKTGEPALSHVRAALRKGRHVVTCNKGPAALAYNELAKLAKKKGAQFRIEGTVMSGTPVLNVGQKDLAGCHIKSVKGILNGTTNFMLMRMGEGKPYAEALDEAQKLGYAEAVPDADVEGYDALAKVLILANTVMGADLKESDVPCKGITKIKPKDIDAAKAKGQVYKLIGTVARKGHKVTASVAPKRLPITDPLASVTGATNAITFETDLLGPVTVVGAGAGRKETGFSILTDVLDIHRTVGGTRR